MHAGPNIETHRDALPERSKRRAKPSANDDHQSQTAPHNQHQQHINITTATATTNIAVICYRHKPSLSKPSFGQLDFRKREIAKCTGTVTHRSKLETLETMSELHVEM